MNGTRKLLVFVRANYVVVAATALSFFVLVTYSASFLGDIIHFNDPRHQNEPLKPWMTPRYVALSYDLPRETVLEVFELDEETLQTRPRVGRIARNMGLTLPELTQRVRAAQADYQATDD